MLFFNYLKCKLKLTFRYLPVALLFLFIISVSLAFLIGGLVSDDDGMPVISEKINVGLVADLEDKYLETGLSAIEMLDSSKNYLKIISYASTDIADEAVRNDEIIGYLHLPERFIQSVLHGENSQAEFVMKGSTTDIVAVIINEVMQTVSDLVVESQVGIFSTEDFYIENNIKNRSKDLKAINVKYIGFVINRKNMAELTMLGSLGHVSLAQYYVCAFIVLLLVLTGILCSKVCMSDNLALNRLLSTNGCGAILQTLVDCFSFVSLIAVSFAVVSVVGSMFTEHIPLFSEINVFEILISVLPALLSVCMLQFFIYELCNNIVSATVLQFVFSMGLAYFSGCIYPLSFFPEKVREFSSMLPFGTAMNYLKSQVLGVNDLVNTLLCVAYAVVFFVFASLARYFKMRSRRV